MRALGVYLCVYQHLPYDRAAQALADLTAARVSTGTLQRWVVAAAAGLSGFDERLRELLVSAPVVHFDETGARIAERLGWVHSQSTEKLTRYLAHRRRGGEAIEAAGVLPDFRGVAVHDGWSPYRNYEDALHALCNGHHLRELIAAAEAGQRWPCAMAELLLDTKERVDDAREAGEPSLHPQALRGSRRNTRRSSPPGAPSTLPPRARRPRPTTCSCASSAIGKRRCASRMTFACRLPTTRPSRTSGW